jgi:hypothetical protein
MNDIGQTKSYRADKNVPDVDENCLTYHGFIDR